MLEVVAQVAEALEELDRPRFGVLVGVRFFSKVYACCSCLCFTDVPERSATVEGAVTVVPIPLNQLTYEVVEVNGKPDQFALLGAERLRASVDAHVTE